MNRDTPGAAPSDDFPFLGPAISPRRREGDVPMQDSGDLAGPFVGGAYGSRSSEEAPSPEPAAGSSAPGFDETYDDAFGGASEAERLENLPAAEWPEDDFPWLLPSEPEGAQGGGEAPRGGGEATGQGETPWRAAGEAEEAGAGGEVPWGGSGEGGEAAAEGDLPWLSGDEAAESAGEGEMPWRAAGEAEEGVAGDEAPWRAGGEELESVAEGDLPWRATGEVEELTHGEAAGDEAAGFGTGGVDHFSWIGERLPQEGAEEPWESEADAGAGAAEEGGAEEEEPGGFPWDEVPGEETGAGGFVAGGAEGGGFDRGFSADEVWGGAGEWSPEPGAAAAEAEGEPEAAAPFDWGEAVPGAGPVAADRWDAGEGFRVEDEGRAGGSEAGGAGVWGAEEPAGAEDLQAEVEVIAPEAGAAPAEPATAAFEAALEPGGTGGGAAGAAGPGQPPVDGAPLPVGEWEAAPDEAQVEAAPAAAPDPLVDVAERLERIAQSLRSGRPIEALEGGDPLQLLIAGYALGYAQSKRGRS